VDLAVAADRRWGVSGAESKLLEDLVAQGSALQDGEEVAVLAVREEGAVAVDNERVDAPFESERMVAHAGHGVVRVARATERVRVLEAPFGVQVVVELGDEVRLGIGGVGGRTVGRAERRVIAVRADAAVVVVLDVDRVRAAVAVDAWRRIPSEAIRV